MQNSRWAYGLRVASVIALPELVPVQADPDVHIRVASFPPPAPEKINFRFSSAALAELDYPGVARFRVANGREITVDPVLSVDDPILRFFLLGPVFGVLLYQRGFFVLHASAVLIGKGALLFAGAKGAGKSTLAARFYEAGYKVVTDDIAAIRFGARPEVMVAYPQLKLIAPDHAPNALGINKKARATEPLPSDAPVPIEALITLEDADSVSLRTLAPSEALKEIITHSYRIEWFHELDKERHFTESVRLAEEAKVCRLSRPRDLNRLDELMRLTLDSVK